MFKKEDLLDIEMYRDMNATGYATLSTLYLPLIGEKAFLFYHMLLAIKQQGLPITNHVLLQKNTGLSIEALEKARKKCEEFLLLRTFFNEQENKYLYILEIPMTPTRFLSHEVLGRLFLHKMGENVVSFYKSNFLLKRKSRVQYAEISCAMNDLLKNNWDEKQEVSFQNVKEDMDFIMHDDLNIIFDEKRFLSGLSFYIFPKNERTKKNMRSISVIATIYGISEEMMKTLIKKGMRLPENKFEASKLKEACIKSKAKYVSDNKDPYKLPPRRFLEYKQEGASLSKADILLVEKLMCEYRLQPEVINILLETCLHKYNQKILGTTVERMGASWLRLKIDTIEKAKEQMKVEIQNTNINNKRQSIVQEWGVEEEVELSDEQLQKIMNNIQELGGK